MPRRSLTLVILCAEIDPVSVATAAAGDAVSAVASPLAAQARHWVSVIQQLLQGQFKNTGCHLGCIPLKQLLYQPDALSLVLKEPALKIGCWMGPKGPNFNLVLNRKAGKASKLDEAQVEHWRARMLSGQSVSTTEMLEALELETGDQRKAIRLLNDLLNAPELKHDPAISYSLTKIFPSVLLLSTGPPSAGGRRTATAPSAGPSSGSLPRTQPSYTAVTAGGPTGAGRTFTASRRGGRGGGRGGGRPVAAGIVVGVEDNMGDIPTYNDTVVHSAGQPGNDLDSDSPDDASEEKAGWDEAAAEGE